MKQYFFKSKVSLYKYLIMVPLMAVTSAMFAKSIQPLIDTAYEKDVVSFFRCGGWLLFWGISDSLIYYFHKIFREQLRKEFQANIRKDILTGILRMDIPQFQSRTPASYLSILQRDLTEIDSRYFDGVCGVYRVICSFVVTLGLLVFMNPVMAVFNVVIAFLAALLPRLFEKKLVRISDAASQKSAAYQETLLDTLNGFNTIKLFSISDRIKERVEKGNRQYSYAQYQNVKVTFGVSWISIMMTQIGYMGTIALGVFFAIRGYLSVGGIITISQLIGGILTPFEELPAYLTGLTAVKGLKKKVMDIVSTKEQPEIATDEKLSAEITVKNVSFSYEENMVLKDIWLQFHAGGKYALIGESGSGKSTLAKLLLSFFPCSSGHIYYGTKAIDDLTAKQIYQIANYMQQDTFLFEDTIWNNITLYHPYSREQVEQVVRMVGLDNYVAGLADGLDTVLEGNGNNLSGGEKQRIGLARSLISGAKVIIFDEVTSNLDIVAEKLVEDTIMKLEGITVILITHRLNAATLSKCNQVILLGNGNVVEQGTYSELMNEKGMLYSYMKIAALENKGGQM